MCGHCGARLYLEGSLEDVAAAPPAATNLSITPARQASSERSAVVVIQTMMDLKWLKDGGVIDTPEFKKLKRGLGLQVLSSTSKSAQAVR